MGQEGWSSRSGGGGPTQRASLQETPLSRPLFREPLHEAAGDRAREGWAPGSWEKGIKGLEGQGKEEGLVFVLERGGEGKAAADDSLIPAPDTQSGAEGPENRSASQRA